MGRISRSHNPLLVVLLIVAALLPGAAAAQTSDAPPSDEAPSFKASTEAEAVPGQLVVKFEEDAMRAEVSDARRDEGLVKEADLELIDAEVAKVEGQSVEETIRNLERRPDVEYAEPDQILSRTGYTDETRFGELWGLNNTGQSVEGVSGSADSDINALEASTVTQGAPNLVVAVIDDGVDFSHPDLAEHAWKNPGEAGEGKEDNGQDDDKNGRVDDVNGWDFYHDNSSVFENGIEDFQHPRLGNDRRFRQRPRRRGRRAERKDHVPEVLRPCRLPDLPGDRGHRIRRGQGSKNLQQLLWWPRLQPGLRGGYRRLEHALRRCSGQRRSGRRRGRQRCLPLLPGLLRHPQRALGRGDQ